MLVNLKPLFKVDKWLYPPVCLICGHAAGPGLDCCAGCRADLPRPAGCCRRCAIALPSDRPSCGACIKSPPPFDSAFAPYVYQTPLDRMVQAFKFQRDLAAGRVMAGLLADEMRGRKQTLPQALIPVPLHPWRQLRRGFNQADFLARDVANALGLRVMRPLRRRRRTAVQSGLPAMKRRGNVRGAFAIRRVDGLPEHAALIDDVMTTGATVAECTRMLKQAGVQRVEVWAVARA